VNLLQAKNLSSPSFLNNSSSVTSMNSVTAENFIDEPLSNVQGSSVDNQTPTIQSTYTSIANGPWNLNSTWDLGSIPGVGATVIIAHQVTVSSAIADSPANVTINPSASLTIDNGSITIIGNVMNNGTINILQTNTSGASQLLFTGSNFTNVGSLVINTISSTEAFKLGSSIASNSVFQNAGTITMNQGKFHLYQGTNFTFNNTGSIVYNDGKFYFGGTNSIFNNTGTITSLRAVFGGASTTVNSNTSLSFIELSNEGTNLLINCNYSVSSEFLIWSGTTFHSSSLSPTYVNGSHINYRGSTVHNRSKEWLSNLHLTGQPYDVWVSEDVDLNVGIASDQTEALELKGSLSILNNARLTMNAIGSERAAAFIVRGDILLGNVTLNPRLVLSSNSNAFVQLYGNINAANSSCTITGNNQAIQFLGSTNQSINMGGNSLDIGRILINKPTGKIFASSAINLTANSGNLIEFQTSTEVNLQGNNLMLANAGNIEIGLYSPIFNSSSSCGVIVGIGAHNINGSGNLYFNGSCELRTGTSAGSLDFGLGNVYISSALVINQSGYVFSNHCHYLTGSNLIYSHSGNRNIGNEWYDEGQSEGQPYNVILAGSSILSYTSGDKQVGHDLSINNGCSLVSDQKLLVMGSVVVQSTGNLTMTSSSGILEMNGSNSTTQYIGKVGGSPLSLNILEIENNNTVKLSSSLNLTASSGTLLDFEHTGTLDLNGYNINFNNTGVGNIKTTVGNAKIIASDSLTIPTNVIYLNGSTTFAGLGKIIFSGSKTLDVKLTSAATYDFSNGIAVFDSKSYLSIENTAAVVSGVPKYNSGSTLAYRYNGTRNIGNEWSNACAVNDNVPVRVDLNGASTIVKMPGTVGCYQIGTSGLRIFQGTLAFDNSVAQSLKSFGPLWSNSSGQIITNSNSTIFLNGSADQLITLPISNTIEKITIDKSLGSKAILASNINVNNVQFLSGNFDLNGNNNVNLSSTGLITGETGGTSSFINSGSPSAGNGYIGISGSSNLPAALTNIGNLGLGIGIVSGNSGAYTIKRFPKEVSLVGGNAAGSVKRVYVVTVTNSCIATVNYNYFDSELNGINDGITPIYLYKSTISQYSSYALVDAIANQISNATNSVYYNPLTFNSGSTYLTGSNNGTATITSTAAGGDWDFGTTWIGGVSPKNVPSANVVINGNVTINQSYNGSTQAVGSLTINTGKLLSINNGGSISVGGVSVNNGTFNINNLGILHLLNGTVFSNNGTFNGNSGSTAIFDGNATVNGSMSFADLNINGMVSFNNSYVVTGSLKMYANAKILTTSPTYQSSSSLTYTSAGAFSTGLEWVDNSNSGAGVPYKVSISNSSSVGFGTSTYYHYILGDLVIENGSSFSLGTVAGGDLKLTGNYQNSGNFYPQNCAVHFVGGNSQTLYDYNGIFNALIVNKNANELKLLSQLGLVGNTGNVLQIQGPSNLNLNAYNLMMSGTSAAITLGSAGLSKIYNGTLIINAGSSISVTSAAGAYLEIDQLRLLGHFDFGNNTSTINNWFVLEGTGAQVLNYSPKYASNSILKYSIGASFTRGLEWAPNATTFGVAGYPNEVQVNSLTTLNLNGGASNLYLGSTLNVFNGGILDMGTMSGSLITQNTSLGSNIISGTLQLSSSTTGDIGVKGDLLINATGHLYTGNSYVNFVGSSIQNVNVSGASIINKIKVNNSTGLKLQSNLTINSSITFVNGTIDLNGSHIISLGSSANIVGESSVNTFYNSSFSSNAYIEMVTGVLTGNNSFGSLGISFNSTGPGVITVRRYPSYTNLIAIGLQPYNNVFALSSSAGNLIGSVSINYSNYVNNGNASGSNLLWTSSTGNSLSYVAVSSTDAANSATSNLNLTIPNASAIYVAAANASTATMVKTTAVNNGLWSDANSWNPIGVPQPGDVVVINHTGFVMDVNQSSQSYGFGKLTINSGKSLMIQSNKRVFFSGNISIGSSSTLTLNSLSSFDIIGTSVITNNGTITCASTSTFNVHDNADFNGQNTTFSSLRIGGAFNTNTQITIADTLRFYSSGSWFSSTKKPLYNVGSTLEYSQGGVVSRGNEWSSTSASGYPYNLRIIGNTKLNVAGNSPAIAKTIGGSLLITSGLFDLGNTNGTATTDNISILGNVSIGSDGGLYLSPASTSKLLVYGNFTHGGTTTEFKAPIGSTLELTGSSASQTINSSTLIYIDGNVRFNNTNSPIILATSILMTGDNARAVFVSSKGIFVNSGESLELKDGADIQLLTNSTIDGSAPTSSLNPTSNIYINNSVSGSTFDYLSNAGNYYTLTVNNTYFGIGTDSLVTFNVNLGIGKIVINSGILFYASDNGTLNTSGYPIYGVGSELMIASMNVNASSFANNCSFWNPGSVLLSPYHVYVDDAILNFPSANYYVRGNLKVDDILGDGTGSTINFSSSTNLYVAGNLFCNNAGNLIATGSSGIITLNGTATQTLSCSYTDIYNLTISKTTGNVELATNLSISGNLQLSGGNLDLKNSILYLNPNAKILSESAVKNIFSSSGNSLGGYIEYTTNYSGSAIINASNNAGIGLTANTSSASGFNNTTIRRYHFYVSGIGNTSSIRKIYSIECTDGIIPFTAGITYFKNDSVLNVLNSAMRIYRSTNINSPSNYIPTASTANTFSTLVNTAVEAIELTPSSMTTFITAANVESPITGVISPGVGVYASNTIADIIAIVNSNGVGAGGATIQIPPNYTYNLLAPLEFNFTNNEPTASNPLVIAGDSLHPATIYAYNGGTNDRDAFIRVLGTDYLTLKNINFVDPQSNINQTSTMEWGIALLKSGPGNGIRYNTIKNCHITMRKINSIATGIYVGNHGSNPNATYTPTAANGTNSNNSIYSNKLEDVNTGIFINGYDDPLNVLQDDNWRIGDTTNATLGNIIINFGGDTSVPAYGIRARNTNQIIVGHNTIKNDASGLGGHNNILTGIEVNGSSNSNSYLVSNEVSLTQGANAFNCIGIVGNMSGTQTLFIDKNNIHDNVMSTGATGNFYGIYSSTPPTTLNIHSNRISKNININSIGGFYGIYNLGGANVNITGNNLDTNTTISNSDCYGIYNNTSGNVNCLNNNIREYTQNGTSGNFYGYCNDNLVVSAFQAGPVENINYNNFSGITVGGAANIFGIVTSQSIVASKNTNVNLLRKYTANLGSITGLYIRRGATIQGLGNSVRNYKAKGDIMGIRITDGATVTLSNDSVADFIQLANGNTYGINSSIASTYASSSSRLISGNNIDNLSNPSGVSGTTLGIFHTSSGSGGPHIVSTTGNRITNITGYGSGATLGIFHTSSGSGGPHNMQTSTNVIQGISGTGSGSTFGIFHTSSGSGGPHNIQIVSNTINSISSSGSGNTYGIFHTSSGSGGSQSSYRNSNSISNIVSFGSGNTYGIFHTSSGSGGPQIYSSTNNIISNLGNGPSGTGATYGIFHTSSGSGGPHRQRVSNNNISYLSSNVDSAIGIKVFHADSVNIERNAIGRIRAKGSNKASGMIVDHNTANTIGIIKNNVIGDIHTTTANATDDLIGVDIKGAVGSNLKVYFNTIYLNDSNNTSGYSSSAFRIDNGTALDLRNNIIINNSTKLGGTTVLKRLGAASNIAATSDYNLYYVNDTTSNSIFNDGVNNIQSFSAYRTYAQTQNNREKNDVQENAQFASIDPSNVSYLDLNPSIPTKAESAGSLTNLGVTNDKNATLRFGSLGYAGSGSASDIGAYEKNYIPYYHMWVGDFSSEWSNAQNWSANFLPSATDSVIIPRVSSPYFQPILALSDASVGQITTRAITGIGPTITLNLNRKLNVKGNIIANGSASYVGAGKVELNGTSLQSISGVNNFSNLDINNGVGVNIQPFASSINMSGRLGLISGNFNTNNNLTLKSTTTYTGYISGAGSGTISGQVTVERKVTGNTGYHYLGSAVNGVSILPDWSDDFSVVGADNYPYNPSLPLTSAYSVWEYNETNPTPNMNYGWVSATSNTDVLYPGKGFSAYIPTGVTVDVKGTVNHGSYTSAPNFSLTKTNTGNPYADGFNLVANPFPSPITWSGLKAATNAGTAKLYGAMHVWITSGPYANTYGTNNGISGTNNISNFISSEQGFFVQDSIPGPLLANNSNRVDTLNPAFYSDGILPNSMHITIEKDGRKDQATLAFYSSASEGFDSEFDAMKFMGYGSPNALIYTKGYNGFNYALNFMPDFNPAYIVPLGIEPKGQGVYNIIIEDLSSFDSSTPVYLEDTYTGVWQDMKSNNTYSINMGNNDVENRFFIHFTSNAITNLQSKETEQEANNKIYCNGKTVFLSYYGDAQRNELSQLMVFDHVGRLVSSQSLTLLKGVQQYEIPSDLAKGSYIIKLQTKDKVYTTRTILK
jgi:hypothetical protein